MMNESRGHTLRHPSVKLQAGSISEEKTLTQHHLLSLHPTEINSRPVNSFRREKWIGTKAHFTQPPKPSSTNFPLAQEDAWLHFCLGKNNNWNRLWSMCVIASSCTILMYNFYVSITPAQSLPCITASYLYHYDHLSRCGQRLLCRLVNDSRPSRELGHWLAMLLFITLKYKLWFFPL